MSGPSTADDEFAAFVTARTPALLRTAYLLTSDQHAAEDLVQSALARAHRAWRRLESTGNAEAYTRRIMYHLQVSWWRRRRVGESLAGEVPEPRSGAGGDHAADTDLRLSVRDALARLTAKQRAVLVLRFFDDVGEAEAADLLGVSVGTVKSQTNRALARLRVVAPELGELGGRRPGTRMSERGERINRLSAVPHRSGERSGPMSRGGVR